MKNIIFYFFLLINAVAFSQNQSDTNNLNQNTSVIFLENGQVIDSCFLVRAYIERQSIYIKLKNGNYAMLKNEDIKMIVKFNDELNSYNQKYNIKLAGTNLKGFSTRFVGGALISLAGSMAVIVGAFTMQKNDEMKYLMYSGCAISGIGIIVSITSFTKSYKAGKYLENYPIYINN